MGYQRIIQSGDNIEYYRYQRDYKLLPFGQKEDQVRTGRSVEASPEDKINNRLRSLYAAKKEIRRTIYSNCGEGDVFLTLTFKENVQDLDAANYEFKKFRQRLEYRLKKKLKYLVVIEFQKRGAIHYHCYLFGIGFVDWKIYEKAWGNGFIRVNKIKDPSGVGNYVSCYMVKDLLERPELKGRKSYFVSRGLNKPVEWDDRTSEPVVRWILENTDIGFHEHYESEYLGEYTLICGKVIN